MSGVSRVCATPGCPTLVASGRCGVHGGGRGSSRDHFGISPSRRGYGPAYRRVRATLVGRPCHWCGRTADTADHLVPVSIGGTEAHLVPACRSCNSARGALLARRGGAGRISGAPAGVVPQRANFFRDYGSPSPDRVG